MLFELAKRETELAKAARHRRLFVLVGTDDRALAEAAAEVLRGWEAAGGGGEGLYMFQPEFADANKRMNYFRDAVEGSRLEVDFRPYKDTPRILGTTYDFAVLDLVNDLKPNDVGRLGGVVRGGGFYVFLMMPLDAWKRYVTKFQATLLVPQFTPNDIRHRLKERVWRSFYSHKGVVIYDVDKRALLKSSGIEEAQAYEPKRPEPPDKAVLPLKVYRLAATQDQVEVLKLFEVFYNKPKKKQALVIIADRGRGKSAAVGLGLAGIGHKLRKAKARVQIVVSAMEYSNLETLLEFVIKGLEALGYKPGVEREGGEIRAIKARGIFVDVVTPYMLLKRENADIVAVDEAAAVPLPVLYAVHKKFDRLVFATTIHGYEGAGRGFSIRFLKYLRESKDTDVHIFEMEEPIRYGRGDPVEEWLFDAFLLNAEPAKIEPADVEAAKAGNVVYLKEEDVMRDEETFRQFFGIYVQAHYRNEPDDLGMLLDAPHHTARALALPNGKVVVSVELAFEGALDDASIDQALRGLKLPGNIIPDRFLKYWRLPEFAKLKGWRIVRIATHPELQDMGLGTLMLKKLEEEARALGMDWLGVGFGVYDRLLKFWIRNGYIPIHLSPERNPTSGEYSVLLVKPLNEKAEAFVKYANVEFRRRLIHSLMGPYNDMSPSEVQLLLEDWGWDIDGAIALSKNQLDRLVAYAYGPMTYENVTDAIYTLVAQYFYSSRQRRPTLPEPAVRALISKVLEARPWKEAAEAAGLRRGDLMLILREIAKVLLFYYYGGEFEVPLFVVGTVKGREKD
ncbi:tRNA(Met) cytidine acetyltransferase TmcA [Pyrobaculum calidifontis]|uniref:tRNA(Met) cytidine acetyltransferase TmcA n=1 Tax=Pyrobaculum calidifontis (strain DSM 21063 / JCM 11548 / VA1) TaxID=410359 RepID=A3MUE0_PYRCJ|nr:tRNA(Met) cytidine acetyltransferase TmcA [Pyrobaculum calidifontis]ABO08257.1 tRNA(Met)-cytidine N(4)-acetyltransferase [Pyrobaculum calidifontis JCM 11548]